jgi:hypothetical protein
MCRAGEGEKTRWAGAGAAASGSLGMGRVGDASPMWLGRRLVATSVEMVTRGFFILNPFLFNILIIIALKIFCGFHCFGHAKVITHMDWCANIGHNRRYF